VNTEPDSITRPWLPKALARVDDIAALDDWEGEPITEAAATVARALAHTISAWHVVSPKVMPQFVPSNDGGIGIVWREQGYALDLDIEPDGRITGWLYRSADKAEATWGDAPDATP
jgi:hypothetical protein